MFLKDLLLFKDLNETLAYFDSHADVIYIKRSEWNRDVAEIISRLVVPFVFYDNVNKINYTYYKNKLSQLYRHKSCSLCIFNSNIRNTQMLGTFALNNFNDLSDTVDYMLIGIAGGDDKGKLRKRDYFKLYEWGPTPDVLKSALINCDILHKCWVTNLIKCMVVNNEKSQDEVRTLCYGASLQREIGLLKPKKIILWSGECKEFFEQNNLSYNGRVNHPSYYLRKGQRDGFETQLREMLIQK